MNNRTHPELDWFTMETEHFNIHYHQGIEDFAQRGARVAEQIYQPVMDQLELEDWGKTDIVFSAEDEIQNGFAVPSDQIFIWVSQNDVAGIHGGSEKWLRLVVTHEFQHIAQFHAHKTWTGIFSLVTVPVWWLEGMAEYMTEEWRVGRSDSRMKIHTYRNTMDQLDPHDDGYAMVKYLAWKYGDSTLVNISNHRLYLNEKDKKWPIWYNFEDAFEEATGQTENQFYEEWRRVMNAYYYAYLAQKESVEELGEAYPVDGFHQVSSLSISSDSSLVAIVGRRDHSMYDRGLYTVTLDTNRTVKEVHHGSFRGIPTWSPDNEQIAVAQYHRGSHGSLINDIRLVDLETGKKSWLTSDMRALHPEFTPDGLGLIFVAHPTGETTQIYHWDRLSGEIEQLSDFTGDIQIQRPIVSPDGRNIAFMIQDIDGAVDIAVMDIEGNDYRKLTRDVEEDLLPVWTGDGQSIVFTSFRNSTPNLYRIGLDGGQPIAMTDVAQGVYSLQRIPNSDRILATSLPDVDSVRIVQIDPLRVAESFPLNIRDRYTAWRTKLPDVPIPPIDYDMDISAYETHPYRPLPSVRPLVWLVLPDVAGPFAMAALNDALGKHMLQGGGVMSWQGELLGGFVSYLNLNYLPLLQVYAAKNFNFNLRNFHEGQTIEALDGGGLVAALPLTGRNGFTTNHIVQAHFRLTNRTLLVQGENWQAIPKEDQVSHKESNLGFTYAVKYQRPHKQQIYLPGNGFGFLTHYEKTLPGLWGETDFSQIWMDAFVNQKIPKTPLVIYARLKWDRQAGEILPQDSLGFTEEAPLYLSPGTLLRMGTSGIIDLPETYSLRGQTGFFPANEILLNTVELRCPLIEKLPVNILGVGIEGLSAALFSDLGYLPQNDLSINTFGAEIKFSVTAEKLPLVMMAFGIGGDDEFWRNVSQDYPDIDLGNQSYFRLSLVNPF